MKRSLSILCGLLLSLTLAQPVAAQPTQVEAASIASQSDGPTASFNDESHMEVREFTKTRKRWLPTLKRCVRVKVTGKLKARYNLIEGYESLVHPRITTTSMRVTTTKNCQSTERRAVAEALLREHYYYHTCDETPTIGANSDLVVEVAWTFNCGNETLARHEGNFAERRSRYTIVQNGLNARWELVEWGHARDEVKTCVSAEALASLKNAGIQTTAHFGLGKVCITV